MLCTNINTNLSYNQLWNDLGKDMKNLSREIQEFDAFRLEYNEAMNWNQRDPTRLETVRRSIIECYTLFKKYSVQLNLFNQHLSKSFRLYRAVKPNNSFKIWGNEDELYNFSLVSTTADLQFAKSWSEPNSDRIIYVLDIDSCSNVFMLEKQSQYEMTLLPGKIEFTGNVYEDGGYKYQNCTYTEFTLDQFINIYEIYKIYIRRLQHKTFQGTNFYEFMEQNANNNFMYRSILDLPIKTQKHTKIIRIKRLLLHANFLQIKTYFDTINTIVGNNEDVTLGQINDAMLL